MVDSQMNLTKQKYRVEPWFSDRGDETLRLNYPALNRESIVFDFGGYVGDWADGIYKKYESNIFVFEPVPEFFEKLSVRFKNNPKVKLFNFALGDSDKEISIFINEDKSSETLGQGRKVFLKCVDIVKFLKEYDVKNIDLMKMNIEGSEYELLNYMGNVGLFPKVKDLQVQFHEIDETSRAKAKDIRKMLSSTHWPTYFYDFVWENWRSFGNANTPELLSNSALHLLERLEFETEGRVQNKMEIESLSSEVNLLRQEILTQNDKATILLLEIESLKKSKSWRYTQPFRFAYSVYRKYFRIV